MSNELLSENKELHMKAHHRVKQMLFQRVGPYNICWLNEVFGVGAMLRNVRRLLQSNPIQYTFN